MALSEQIKAQRPETGANQQQNVKMAIDQSTAHKQDTAGSAKTLAAQLYTGNPVPTSYLNKEDRESGLVVYSGHRGDLVDLITVNGKLLFGTKLNSPEYISITYPKDHMFEIELNGVDISKMELEYGGNNNKFIAKPFPLAQKSEVPLKTTSPEQVATLNSTSKLAPLRPNEPESKSAVEEMWGNAVDLYGSGNFSCPITKDTPLKEVLQRLREPQPGVLRLVPTVSSNDATAKDDFQKRSAAGCVVIDQNKTELRSPGGSAMAVQGTTVYQFGDRYYSSPNEMKPQQLTGFTTSRNPVEDVIPKSNVLLPTLQLLPQVDAIMVIAKFGYNIYKIVKDWDKVKKILSDSAKSEQSTVVHAETLNDRLTAQTKK